MALHPSVWLAWNLANRIAWSNQSMQIEPVHFYLASLQIIDDAYQVESDQFHFTSEQIMAVEEIVLRCREVLGKSRDELTLERRQLRKRLGLPTILAVPEGLLHRSTQTKEIFTKAMQNASRQGNEAIHLLDLLNNLLPHVHAFFSEPQRFSGEIKGHLPDQANLRLELPGHKSTLNGLGRDLTDLARKGTLAGVIGREAEILAITRILHRTRKRNVILIGKAGVGKTAIIEGLAQRLALASSLDYLRSIRIVQISVADLVAGTMYRGEMERRLQAILAEAVQDPNIVLFFDEIHLAMKTGAAGESSLDIANILKPALAREDFRCIGATTIEDYERYIQEDEAFMRRFQVLTVQEPGIEETLAICRSVAARIEQKNHITIQPEAIEAAVTLSNQFIIGRSQPDKAIDLLESAATRILISSLAFSDPAGAENSISSVGELDVQACLEEEYGISAGQFAGIFDLNRIETLLRSEIIGQDRAIRELLNVLERINERRETSEQPVLGSLLLMGPAGTGLSRSARLLSHGFAGQKPANMLSLDMRDYKGSFDLSRLTGAAPGLIGHGHASTLFHFVASCPQGVILLDNFEKAHPEIQDYVLNIIQTGHARDSRGRVTLFKNYLFVLTVSSPPTETPTKVFPQIAALMDRVIVYSSFDLDGSIELFNSELRYLEASSISHPAFQIHLDESTKLNIVLDLTHRFGTPQAFIREFEQIIRIPVLKRYAETSQCQFHLSWVENRVHVS